MKNCSKVRNWICMLYATSPYQQEVIEELHGPSVKSVVKEIKSSYLNILPGLPYPELPVVSIISEFFFISDFIFLILYFMQIRPSVPCTWTMSQPNWKTWIKSPSQCEQSNLSSHIYILQTFQMFKLECGR